MKNIIVLGVVAVVLFSVSAGLSLFLNTQKTDDTKTTEKEKEKEKKAKPTPDTEPPVVRPGVNSAAEDTSRLAAQLREQMGNVKERETKLETRNNQITLMLQDIRSEREVLDRLRQQISAELKLVSDKSADLDKKFAELESERKNLAKGNADLSRTRTEYEKDERTNLGKMALLYDSMAPENAAKILQQLADTGKMDTAVKVLAQMKPAKASRVLAEMQDTTLSAQLMDKMKTLKPASATGTPTEN